MQAIDLGVNIDHVATLRNVRGVNYPDPIQAALQAEEAGADLITLHLREDRRHIKDADLIALRPLLKTRMNLECAITSEMLDIACMVKPQDVCLVPEKRTEVTTEGGLDVITHVQEVQNALYQLNQEGIRVSLFIDPSIEIIQACHEMGVKIIELHTGAYANAEGYSQEQELQRIELAAEFASKLGIKVNAGHGLHEGNVWPVAQIVSIQELNIGHALVAQAIFKGWKIAIQDMKALMQSARRQALIAGEGSIIMIFGIGNDLLIIERMAKTFERTQGRIVNRILGPSETTVYHSRRKRNEARGLAYLCTRFAAKEAFSKAIGLGMHSPMTWRSVEILNDSTGKPYLIYHGALAEWMVSKNLHGQVTITDEENMVSAVVIVSSQAP